MKSTRIFIAIVAMLAFASVCAAQTDASAGDTESKIIANEKMITDSILKNDPDTFKGLVSMDAWVVNDKGVAKVSDTLGNLFDSSVKTTTFTMEQPKVMVLNPDTAIITYKSLWVGTANGKTHSETSYDSTLWARRDGKWWAVFHQSTMVEKPQTKIPMEH